MSKRSSGERGNEFLSLNGILRMKEYAAMCVSAVQRTLFSEGNLFPRVLAVLVVNLLLTALPLPAKVLAKATPKTAPLETAVIENTGSTNTTGYKITVYSIGGARIGAEARGLPLAMNKRLFIDLKVAMPLTSLPVRHGMRSASFGTRTFITYKGQRSPDLTFGGDTKTAALKADVDAITMHLQVNSKPRIQYIPVPSSIKN